MTDAVLIVGFGGPETPDQIRPFVVRVLEGRVVPAGRIEEVVEHYRLVGGVSPYVSETRRLAEAVARELARRGRPLPVLTGFRYCEPGIEEPLRLARSRGIGRLAAVSMTPWGGSDAGDRYRSSVRAVMDQLEGTGALPGIAWVPAFHEAAGFLEGWADRIRAAAPAVEGWHLLFTAHSVPLASAEPYRGQVRLACERIARRLGRPDGRWSLAWQSRSGRPDEPWLGPDVLEALRDLAASHAPAVLAAPIGFLCDHVEILYDLGVEARAEAQRLALPFHVCPALSDHPLLADHLAGAVLEALA